MKKSARSMRNQWRILILVAVGLAVAAPLAVALSGRSSEELEQNRRLLEKIRTDPEHYARLSHDLKSFRRLRPEVRARMRQLDRDLQAERSGEQVRLRHAGERYARWLQRLSTEQRQQIEQTSDPRSRLALIGQIRQAQWLEHLPKEARQQIQKTQGTKRLELIRKLKMRDRHWRHLWRLARTHWDEVNRRPSLPHGMRELTVTVNAHDFVQNLLLPQLSPDEKGLLDDAEGSGVFPLVLVELIDRHPVLLPGPVKGAAFFRELPQNLQDQLAKLDTASKQRLLVAEGKWPAFAQQVAIVAMKHNLKLPKPLGPSRPAEFGEDFNPLFRDLFDPVHGLSKPEQAQLKKAEGFWPRYPRLLLHLAVKHHRPIPRGAPMALPGAGARWDGVRRLLKADQEPKPLVSDLELREFARTELTSEEWLALGVSLDDPWSRRRLQDAFIKRHPEEWLKLQLSDQQKRQ